jgi:uroporphyrinogen III methyltransferase/synthase
MVVGDVVKLREELNWYELKPLFGVRVLVTREHSRGFELLEDMGAEVIEFPSIRVVPPESWKEMDAAIDELTDEGSRRDYSNTWLIFTSPNGVKYFFERYLELDRDIRDLRGVKICAVGTKTAASIHKHGLRVDMVPEKFRAEGLIESFKDLAGAGDLKGMRFILPRAEKAREIFPETVREMGGEITVPVAYRAEMPQRHPKRLKQFLKAGRITVATFTSGATFKNFMELMNDEPDILRDVTIAAIGPVTRKTIEKAGLEVHIMPDEATVEALVEAIIRWGEGRAK